MLELILLAAGAIAGVVADRLWRITVRKVTSVISSRRLHLRAAEDRSAQAAAISFYRAAGWVDGLYVTRTLPVSRAIAVLRDPSENDVGPIPLKSDAFLVVGDPMQRTFAIDDRVIAHRQRVGRLWDGSVLYVSGRQPDPGRPGHDRTVAGVCNYYSYVTMSDRVLHTYLKGFRGKRTVIDSLSSFPMAVSGSLKPIAIAGTGVCAFDSENGPLVLVHRRSDDVISSRGLLGLTPLYGMESNIVDSKRSRYGVIAYNFLKEFLEELYSQEGTERLDTSRKLHPDWMFRSAAAGLLLRQFKKGTAELKALGSCIDCSDGTYTYVVMAYFHDPSYLEQFMLESQAGWELQALEEGTRPFSLLPVFGAEIEQLAVPETMSAVSIYAIDLLRDYLKRNR